MKNLNMPNLVIGDLVSKKPILQGGMGVGISLSSLASASAKEGCVGVIAANAIGMIEPNYLENGKEANISALRKEIRKAKKQTDGPIGVNIMVATNDFQDLLRVSIEERADIVILGAGLPIKGIPVKELREANVKVLPIVSSKRATNLIFKSWHKKYNDIPDGVIVEGPKAGGHLGYKPEEINDPNFSLENLLPGIIDVVKGFEKSENRKIPVIAAGGIFTGEDIHKFLKLGASGVQMGTRFVATDECDADIRFKQSYIESKEDDLLIIKSPVGMPGRAIRNEFLSDVENGVKKRFKCPWRCLEHCDIKTARYCISSALGNARIGNLSEGYAFAGSNAYKVNEIVPVSELVSSLDNEYSEAVRKESKAEVELDDTGSNPEHLRPHC